MTVPKDSRRSAALFESDWRRADIITPLQDVTVPDGSMTFKISTVQRESNCAVCLLQSARSSSLGEANAKPALRIRPGSGWLAFSESHLVCVASSWVQQFCWGWHSFFPGCSRHTTPWFSFGVS